MGAGDGSNRELERVLDVIGPQRFNRLVHSVHATREKGRLRHWQEQLFARVAADAGVRVGTVGEFVRLFADAVEQPVPRPEVDRDEFMRRMAERPFDFPLPLEEVPPAWMAEAWGLDCVRETHADEMARTVSKVGQWAYDGRYARLLARSLTAGQLVDLFVHVRGRSPHREAEFRPGFGRAFPDIVAALPQPLTREELIELAGEDLFKSPEFDAEVDEDIPE